MKKLIILISLVNYSLSNAQLNVINQSRIPISSIQTLLFVPNASNGGMSGCGTASEADVSNWSLNVAKNAFQTDRMGFSISYMPNETQLIKSMYMGALNGFITPKNRNNETFSFSLSNYNYGSVEYRDNNAVFLGNRSSNELSIKVGYARKLSKYSSAGIAIGYYYSNLFSSFLSDAIILKPANGINGDIGYYRNGNEMNKRTYFNYGLALMNVGGKVNYGDLKANNYAPMQFRMGSSYNYKFGNAYHSRLSLNLDLSKDLFPTPKGRVANNLNSSSLGYLFTTWADAPKGFKEEMQELRFQIGSEFNYKNIVAFRAGYQYENKYKGDRKYLSLGIGIIDLGDKNRISIDGSYSLKISKSTIGLPPTFRLSMSIKMKGHKSD